MCRYEKRHTNISAHISPCFRCNEGDTVTIGQCRWAAQGSREGLYVEEHAGGRECWEATGACVVCGPLAVNGYCERS